MQENSNPQNEFEVQQIIARKNTKAGVMYYVIWRGYSQQQATWEPLTNLLNSFECVRQYERSRKKHYSGSRQKQSNMEIEQSQKQGNTRAKIRIQANTTLPVQVISSDEKIGKLMERPEIEGELEGQREFKEINSFNQEIGDMEIEPHAICISANPAKSEIEDFHIVVNFLEETPQLEQNVQDQLHNENSQCGNHVEQFGFGTHCQKDSQESKLKGLENRTDSLQNEYLSRPLQKQSLD